MHRLPTAVRLCLVLAGACASLSGSTVLYYARTGASTSLSSTDSGFVPNVGFSTENGLDQSPLNGVERTESWAATGNISDGSIHLYSSAGINPGSLDFTGASINAYASMGDTINYAGTSIGGLDLTARVTITGSWTTFTPFGDTLDNFSYLRVMYLQPGSFNTPNFFASSNIIAQAFYGLGPNAEELPFGVNYSAFVSSFPGTIDLPIPLSSLPQGAQVAFVAQNWLEGTMPAGGDGLGWIADLGNTLHVELIAPEGVTVTTAGGLPTASASSVPEPAGFVPILAVGLAAGLWRLRLSSKSRSTERA